MTVGLWIGRRMFIIDAKAFSTTISHLIMHNQCDRALHLCDQFKHVPLCHAIKGLILRVNRSYSLELAYHEGILVLRNFGAKDTYARRQIHITHTITLLLTVFTTYRLADPGVIRTLIPWFCGLVISQLMGWMVLWSVSKHLRDAQQCLLEVRNLIYGRANYVPPPFRPRTMTAEELRDWSMHMATFETKTAERKQAGEKIDTPEEYDRQAGPDGILPPL